MRFLEYLEKKNLLEMALHGAVERGAVKIDKDDLEFLYQFPFEYEGQKLWASALLQRYNRDLYKALSERERSRRQTSKEMKTQIYRALKSGRYNKYLVNDKPGLFTRDMVHEIKRDYGKEWREKHRGRINDASNNVANNLAFYMVERVKRDVTENDNQVRTYTFKFGTKVINVDAKPFINRLAHKLERTAGETHSAVGLDDGEHPHGRYGFDLTKPHPGQGKLPRGTAGMQMPLKKTIARAIHKLIADNFHRIYGDLPESGETKNIPGDKEVKIEKWKNTKFVDTRLTDEFVDAYKSKFSSMIPFDHFKGSMPAFDVSLEDGTKLTKEDGSSEVHVNEPNGKKYNIKIYDKRNYGIFITKRAKAEFERKRKDDDRLKMVKGPPIPGHPEHSAGTTLDKKQDMHLPVFKTTVKVNGKDVEVEMPYLNPARYYRNAKPDDRIERRVGYKKDKVPLDHDEYDKAIPGHQSGASIHPNQNKPKERSLKFGTNGYDEAIARIFGRMKKYPDSDPKYPGLYKDIVEGISQVRIDSRGVTAWEHTIAMSNVKDIHDIVVAKMERNLLEDALSTKSGRKLYARNETTNLLQQSMHGGGTRRTRDGSMGVPQVMPTTLISQDDIEFGSDLHNKLDHLSERGRKPITGRSVFPYRGHQLRSIVKHLIDKAEEADRLNTSGNIPHGETTTALLNLFKDKFTRKMNLLDAMHTLLKEMIHDEKGIVDNELEREATHVLDTVVNPKKTMAQMLTQFSQLTIVQDFMSGNVMDRDANRNSAQTSSSSPINMAAPRLKLTAATPGVGSGTEDGPSPEIIRMASEHHPNQLKEKKEFLALAFNHNYITHRNEESLNNLKKKIIEKKATTLPNDYNAAIRLIDDQLKIRFPKEM